MLLFFIVIPLPVPILIGSVGKCLTYFVFLGYLQSSDRGTRQFSDSFFPAVKFPTAHIEFVEEKNLELSFIGVHSMEVYYLGNRFFKQNFPSNMSHLTSFQSLGYCTVHVLFTRVDKGRPGLSRDSLATCDSRKRNFHLLPSLCSVYPS